MPNKYDYLAREESGFEMKKAKGEREMEIKRRVVSAIPDDLEFRRIMPFEPIPWICIEVETRADVDPIWEKFETIVKAERLLLVRGIYTSIKPTSEWKNNELEEAKNVYEIAPFYFDIDQGREYGPNANFHGWTRLEGELLVKVNIEITKDPARLKRGAIYTRNDEDGEFLRYQWDAPTSLLWDGIQSGHHLNGGQMIRYKPGSDQAMHPITVWWPRDIVHEPKEALAV